MADRLTQTSIRTFDRLRGSRSITGTLRLDKATATGYVQVGSSIANGWYLEFTQDRTTGEQFLQVLLAESSEWTPASLKTTVAAIVYNGLRYKVNGKRQPEGAPFVWILTCASTGEAV